MVNGRRFFYTRSGYLGIGTDTMEPGDLLYGLKNCVHPALLRRVDSYYELIGTCIVQGLMDGETQAMLEEDLDLEQIEIR
jgi:hypothetical protein